ncbi:S8 family peptidase [Streptomyces sp. NPDC003077]|uniref:S8 family peptidase n=1 Tax=Streptomyces sp. NPDC003077 TaxID=3154443 RepID=UPI00339F2E68
MRTNVRRLGAVAVATAAAVALAAGMTAPSAGAQPDNDAGAGAGAGTATAAKARTGPVAHWITLITGDRVAVDDTGRPVTVRRAPGRDRLPLSVRSVDGHHYAVPLDAQRLIREGRLDPRLFDLTLLSRPEYRAAEADGPRLIVGYRGAAPEVKRELRAAGDTEIRRTLPKLNAEAVTADHEQPGKVWEALTNEPAGGGSDRTAAAGVARVWLDGVRTVRLDQSVPQIGAPTAWKAGYDGKGTKIAVLDTGVAQNHPDLAGQEIAEKNFSDAADNQDRYGHGTHVASIAAGTGAKSQSKYKGVAPGARILDGKVLGDDGAGSDSGIIAGMEWAVAQKADVVNLSLGGSDAPGIDPLEEAVNRLSAASGSLFVIAAGNSGPGRIDTPGSAEAALTVGAVDKKDQLADFSGTGPRTGDAGIKPDLTAPGVDIAAAASPGSLMEQEAPPVADGYLAGSGTSMATPHVAGAAAILKQRHPDWSGERIKAALTASAAPHAGYSAYQQGTGRVDVAKALTQTVVAEPVSVNFGTQQWPHADDKPVTKQLTYRNLGSAPVTLDLSLTATGPTGKPAPEETFRLGARQVTVPAGGTAQVPLTADTRPGGNDDGAYTAYVLARGGDQTVRTAAAVVREVESYDVTFRHLGRDGAPATSYDTSLTGIAGLGQGQTFTPFAADGTATARLPKGRYLLSTYILGAAGTGEDWLVAPNLTVTKAATVTLDARTAKPVDMTVPDRHAEQTNAFTDVEVADGRYAHGSWGDSFQGLRTAHVGPKAPAGEVRQQFIANWGRGVEAGYNLAYGWPVTTVKTGFVKHARPGELAKAEVRLGSSVTQTLGIALPVPSTGSAITVTAGEFRALPYLTTQYVNGVGAKWSFGFNEVTQELDPIANYGTEETAYKPGASYRHTLNVGVFGPALGDRLGLFREGDRIYGALPVFADGEGHSGDVRYDKVTTNLYRDGVWVSSNKDPLTGAASFKVPAGRAHYKLSTTVVPSKHTAVSTEVRATWTFSSAHTTAPTALPATAVRFTPALAPDSTAKAKARTTVPITVQGSAAGSGLKALTVYVSYDGGAHWQKTAVHGGKNGGKKLSVTVRNPDVGKGISFKASVTDKRGNTLTQTIVNAYRGK